MLKEAVASTLGIEDAAAYSKEKAGNLGFDLFPNKGEPTFDGPRNFKMKASSYDDTIFSSDPTRMVPRLKQIHKLGSGLLPGLGMGSQMGPLPGMMDAYYADMTAQDAVDEEDVDPELLMMAGPQAAQGAQFVRRTKKLVDKEKRKVRSRSTSSLLKVGAAPRKSCFDESVRLVKKNPDLTLMKGAPFKGSGDRAHFWAEDANGRIIDPTAHQYPKETRVYTGGRPVSLERNQAAVSRALEKRGWKLRGRTTFQGMRIAIENRKGEARCGKDRDGKKWRTVMRHPYGYIVGSKGADGGGVDVYVGPDKKAPDAYVVHQRDKRTGKYDEDKVMLGFRSKKEAKEAFLSHYDSPKFLGPIKRVEVDRLRELVASKRRLVKIAAKADQRERKERFIRFIREAGPGIGGATGLALGAASGARKGQLLRRALMGLGTGATIGWTPDIAASTHEAVSRLRR